MNTENNFTVVPFAEIETKYSIKIQDYELKNYFDNIPTSKDIYENPTENTFAVYEGNTTFEKLDLTIAGFDLTKPESRALLVIGDLMVNNTINMFGSDIGYPMYLYVTGNLTTNNILIKQLGEVIVEGNIFIKKTLFAVDMSVGKVACKGSLNVKNAYINSFRIEVNGKTNIEKFYVYENIESTEVLSDLDDLKIKLAETPSSTPIWCAEPGIKYFKEMSDIYDGTIDYDTIDEVEQKKLEGLFIENRIFIDDVYSTSGFDAERIDEKILKGIEIFIH